MVARAPRRLPTTWELLEAHGVTRREFMRYCTMTAAAMGLAPGLVPRVAHALQTKPRIPVIWLHGLECTCCSESFIRSSHPIAQDIILNMISLDYDDTLQAAAGHQVEAIRRQVMHDYPGQYVLAVEGNAPTADGGVYCTVGGQTFERILLETAEQARFVIAWGSCASNGCIQAARPNPTGAVPVHKLVKNKPIVKVPGCPPIAEVMTGVLTHVITFDRLPELDRIGRPLAFYRHRVHDKCPRRAFFDAGQFVERWDDEGARKGWCLYKMGCRGPTTYNACPTCEWNGGVSFPIGSGHGCIGCSEANFWDDGPFYSRLAPVPLPGVESTPQAIGAAVALTIGGAAVIHGAATAVKSARDRRRAAGGPEPDGGGAS